MPNDNLRGGSRNMLARIGFFGLVLGGCFCAVSTGLPAEDWLERDVYARPHEPADQDADDRVLTAKIKRHLAQLMYPVDLTKFDPPARDPQFGGLIRDLQKRMGVSVTGVLTEREFRRLEEAASGIEAEYVGLGIGKNFFLSDQSDWAVVDGTGVADPPVADTLNIARITCRRQIARCDLVVASFDRGPEHSAQLWLDDYLRSYDVTEWAHGEITGIDVAPCGTATLSIDFKQKTARIVSVPHGNSPMCQKANAGIGKTDVWMLTDGFEVARRVYDKRLRDSLALVYGPARDLINRQMFGSRSTAADKKNQPH